MSNRKLTVNRILTLLLVLLLVLTGLIPQTSSSVQAKDSAQEDGPTVDPELTAKFNRSDSVGYLIYFEAEADLSAAYSLSWEERGWYVYDTLTALAEETQWDVRSFLDAQGVAYETFWIDNAIAVESSTRAAFEGLLTYSEIESLTVIHEIQLEEPVSTEVETERSETRSVETNLTHINADDVWAAGYTGTNIVVGSIDTGVNYTHEVLVDHYRGNLGDGSFDHNYSWWDVVNYQTEPYDDHSHGSHTVGIMLGDDGSGNQIGVAPGTEWIACKAFDNTGSATDTSLLACGQFMVAPTRLDGTDADPDMRPHVVNNSWGDCSQTYSDWYQDTIDAWLAAGIYPVFSAGNAGNCRYTYPPGLNTVGNPARSFNVTAVGSTGTNNGEYATHSNWGPTDSPDTLNGGSYPKMKPQVVAPGVYIRSAVGDAYGDSGYGFWDGTSMAAPHVTGLIALMWDAASCLVGDYVNTETILQDSTVPIYYDDGMGEGARWPNYATGWGEIDAEAAVFAAIAYCGDSFLDGVVRDAFSQPVDGATVEAEAQGTADNDRWGKTDETGYYKIAANSGETYDLTATAYGYQSTTTSNVTLTEATIETNFNLTDEDGVTVSGTITDDNDHNYPLYTFLVFHSELHHEELFTNPFNGTYSVALYQNTAYDLTLISMIEGFAEKSVSGLTFNSSPATSNQTVEISTLCFAPGYVIVDGDFPDNCEKEPGGVLAGYVSDEDTGIALNGASVFSSSASGTSGATPNDPGVSDGFYWLFQPMGSSPLTLSFTGGGGVYVNESVDLELTQDEVTRHDFNLDTLRTFFSIFRR